ncbi:hypothetical protein [Methylocaldum szegediense]|jgi:hypothetical protein|uniref:hypothetical protein n=1 Tax=Methylocaldum szegediense TaxID=73780 RepID=UPI000478D234|nr:hypothetical protein [Methylocaldum szegediense]
MLNCADDVETAFDQLVVGKGRAVDELEHADHRIHLRIVGVKPSIWIAPLSGKWIANEPKPRRKSDSPIPVPKLKALPIGRPLPAA